MSLERLLRMNKKEGSGEDSPHLKGRNEVMIHIESMSPEELESSATAAGLSESEKIAAEHWRTLCSLTDEFSQRQAVRDLYFAAKHPSLKKIFDTLNIGVGTGYNKAEWQQSNKLDELDKQFSPGNFESALEKIQKTLG